jgi:hypothetical protein
MAATPTSPTRTGAMLIAGRFDRASFRGADLDRAMLTGATFDRADFRGASLDGAILAGANLAGARNLRQSQLDEACGDDATRLPAGLKVKACGNRRMIVVRDAMTAPAPPAPPAPPAAPPKPPKAAPPAPKMIIAAH